MPKNARSAIHEDKNLVCRDCSGPFTFTVDEQNLCEAKGFGAMVRCVECRLAKKARYAQAEDVTPAYDAATEAKLDAWVAAKRSKAFDVADKLRAALRADGIDTESARPVGYVAPAKPPPSKQSVKCFNCGAKGHRSEECKQTAGSTTCYHCGSAEHKGRDCPAAPAPKRFDPMTATCFNCGATGHVAAACTERVKGSTACHICGEHGHVRRYCPRARDKPLPAGADDVVVDSKLREWASAREAKDYESADRLRAELMALGVNPNKPTKAKKAQ